MSELITIDTGIPEQTATKIKNKYEPYKLVAEDTSVLYDRTDEFKFDGEVNATELAGRLTETLKLHRGFGLSATQCGLPYRVFVMGAEDDYISVFNPTIVSSSDETLHMEEGCLTFPLLTLAIGRSKEITVKYQNELGENIERVFAGISARIFLHEYDHLNGITFNNVAKPLALKMGLKRREKQMKQFSRELVRHSKTV
jgi:peptide deformylase